MATAFVIYTPEWRETYIVIATLFGKGVNYSGQARTLHPDLEPIDALINWPPLEKKARERDQAKQ